MLWLRLPFLKLLFSLVLGILLADLSKDFFTKISPFLLFLPFGICFLLFPIVRDELIKSLLLYFLFMFIGFGLTISHFHQDRSFNIDGQEEAFLVDVKTVLSSTAYYHRYLVVQKQVRKQQLWRSSTATVLLKESVEKQRYMPGDMLLIKGQVSKVRGSVNPNQFDYAKYLGHQHVYYQIRSFGSEKMSEQFSLKRVAHELRGKLLEAFQSSAISSEHFPVLMAILLGDKSELDTTLRNNFSRAGAMHVLAVSGLHLGIVFMLLDQLIRLLSISKRSVIRVFILTLTLWGFALLTGMSSSVMRAALMFTFLVCADLLKRKGAGLNSVAASAVFLLLLDPLRLFQIGFQLSYTAVFGILTIYPPLSKLFKSKNELLNKLIDLTLISIAAQVSTLPLTLVYFHQFPNLFLISNIFVIPLAFLIVGSGFLASLFHLLFGSMLELDKLLDLLLGFLSGGVAFISKPEWAATEGIWLQRSSIILFVVALVFIVAFLHLRKTHYIIKSFVLIVTILLIENLEMIKQSSQDKLTVYSTAPVKLISIKQGLSAVVLTLDSLTEYERNLVKSHLDAMKVRTTNTYNIKGFEDSLSLLHFKNDQFLLMDYYQKQDENTPANHLIVRRGERGFVQPSKGVKMIQNTFTDSLLSPHYHNLRDSIFQIAN